MKRLFAAIILSMAVCSAFGQANTTININIKDPVKFKEVLLPGASAKALELYSSFAVNKNAAFYFENATIGGMTNCRYSLICENGKISAIYLQTDNDSSCEELRTFASTTFGKPQREVTEKNNGREDSSRMSFNTNGLSAELVTSSNKGGYLAVK